MPPPRRTVVTPTAPGPTGGLVAQTPVGPRLPFRTVNKGDILARFSLFVWGFSGAGKTYLARTAVESDITSPILVCVCDRGHLTLKDRIDGDKMVVTLTPDFADFNPIYDFLKRGQHPFKTVMIDNITELHRRTLVQRADVASQGKSRTAFEFTMQDFGVVRNQVLALVSTFVLDLNMNVVVTALAMESQDDSTGTVRLSPDIPGKLGHEIPGFFDFVGYLSVQTPTAKDRREAEREGKEVHPVRHLQLTQTSRIQDARNRAGVLGDFMINPTLPQIAAAVTKFNQQQGAQNV